jgi:hypothetical protein
VMPSSYSGWSKLRREEGTDRGMIQTQIGRFPTPAFSVPDLSASPERSHVPQTEGKFPKATNFWSSTVKNAFDIANLANLPGSSKESIVTNSRRLERSVERPDGALDQITRALGIRFHSCIPQIEGYPENGIVLPIRSVREIGDRIRNWGLHRCSSIKWRPKQRTPWQGYPLQRV